MILLTILAACAVEEKPDLVGGDTCTALESGTWYAAGAAFGMPSGSTEMTVELAMDAEACTFTLGSWNMDMGPLADFGAIDVEAITLSGPTDYWDSCTGTAADSGTATGTCNEDGGAFELTLAP